MFPNSIISFLHLYCLLLGLFSVEALQKDEPSCGKIKKADVMFVYDSGTLGAKKIRHINRFVEDVVQYFNMASGNIRAGILTTNCYRGDFSLSKHTDRPGFVTEIRNLEIPDLSTVVRRLRLHAYNLENGGRRDVKKMAVIFMDDKLQVPKKVKKEISRAKFAKIEVFVVTVGDAFDPAEVHSVCSDPPSKHVINFKSYESLSDVKNANSTRPNFINIFCNGESQTRPTSSKTEATTTTVATTTKQSAAMSLDARVSASCQYSVCSGSRRLESINNLVLVLFVILLKLGIV